MGESATQKVREIEEVRDRLDVEMDALGQRVPWWDALVKRMAMAAAGGAAALFSVWFALHRLKIKLQDRRVRRLVVEALEEADAR